MPRRPWRSLNAFSASPIRVPLDQSGAAAAARWIARSGLREASARVSARQPRGEHERLGVRAAARGAGQELQVGARVGLHRARDVAQQHEPARDDAPAPAREPDRVAAGAQAAAQRAAHVDRAGRGAPARSGACAAAASRPRAATSAGRAARARAARARRSACRRAAPRRWPAPAARRPRPRPSSSPGRAAATAPRGRAARRRRRPLAVDVGARRRGVATSALGAASTLVAVAAAEDRAEHARRTPRRAPGRRRTRRAPSSTAAGGRPAAPASSARAKSAERSGVTGTPASCRRRLSAAGERRQVELDRLDAEVSHRCARAARGRPRGSPPGPRRTSAPSRACGRPPRRRAPRCRAGSSAASQSIASAIPGGFCTSLSRMRETASATCTASVSRRALHAPAHDLHLALRASGSRSSGTGSGA